MRRVWALVGMAWALAGPVAAECRQALALGLDVSGSVDGREYRLQTDGLAEALLSPEIEAAFLTLPELPVRLMIFEWAGREDQRILQDWITVTKAAQLNAVAARLRATPKAPGEGANTGLSAAILFGAEALRQQDCPLKTLDISGDGPGNSGRHPADIPPAWLRGIVVNGLVIAPDARANTSKNLHNVKTLEQYYRDYVLHGPGAFVVTARDHADFARAMRTKLERELRLPNLSGLMQKGRSGSSPRPFACIFNCPTSRLAPR